MNQSPYTGAQNVRPNKLHMRVEERALFQTGLQRNTLITHLPGYCFCEYCAVLSLIFSPFLCYSNDGAQFGGSIYQKVSPVLETAVNLAWTAGSNSTNFGIAAKYQLDKSASISVSTEHELLFVSVSQTHVA